MKNLRRCGLTGLFLLVSAGLTPSSRVAHADAVAKPCDCCSLVCIEAEIIKAQAQRDYYKKAAATPNLTLEAYEAGEAEAGRKAESQRIQHTAGLPACEYYDPNLADDIEMRRFVNAGFTFKRNKSGVIIGADYTIATDVERCTLADAARQMVDKVTPCQGMGGATLLHELKHLEDCDNRKEGERHRTPQQTAADEVLGYEEELKALDNLRTSTAATCFVKSCEDQEDWDKAADDLILDVYDVLQRAGSKPASKSPLAKGGKRTGQGGGR